MRKTTKAQQNGGEIKIYDSDTLDITVILRIKANKRRKADKAKHELMWILRDRTKDLPTLSKALDDLCYEPNE